MPALPLPAAERTRLLRVALGEAPPDLLLAGGRVVNVYTGEVLAWDVAVAGERIAAVGPDLGATTGPGTRVLDVAGKVLVPGFIDGHTHLDNILTVPELLRVAVPRGLTAFVSEMAQITSALGLPGARWFLEGLRDQPIHCFATAPVITFLTTEVVGGAPAIEEGEMAALLEEPQVLGLGEIYWHLLLERPERLLPLIERARALGKSVEGHSAGARGAKLCAFSAAGAGSCHEPITAGEALERLRLGLHVLIREGSVRQDLEAVAAGKDEGVSLRRAALVSDGIWPVELVERGYMDAIVQRAIDLGVPPVTAYQMASLNVAEHYGLDGDLGGIAPGRSADILVLPDLREVRPELVIARGRLAAREGRLLVEPRPLPRPPAVSDGLRLGPISADTFGLPARGRTARVRVIRIAGDILTAEDEATVLVRDGRIEADPGADLLLAAVLARRGSGMRAVGLLRGLGLRAGALASTFSFDTADLVVAGTTPEAMAGAVRHLIALGGGVVAVDDAGTALAAVPLPLGGVASPAPIDEMARDFQAIEDAARRLGCRLPRPLLTLATLTFQAIPALRLTPRGLLEVKTQRFLDLLVP